DMSSRLVQTTESQLQLYNVNISTQRPLWMREAIEKYLALIEIKIGLWRPIRDMSKNLISLSTLDGKLYKYSGGDGDELKYLIMYCFHVTIIARDDIGSVAGHENNFIIYK
ncbi:hypothetical protein ACJX0J_025473, partial [Zea mays]